MAAIVAARNWRTRTGYAWALISFGLFMIAAGEVAWGIHELGMGGEVPFPSAADVGYLGIYPPVFLGLLLMPPWIMARQILTIYENVHLNRGLAQRADELF